MQPEHEGRPEPPELETRRDPSLEAWRERGLRFGLPTSITGGQKTSVALSHQLWPSAAAWGHSLTALHRLEPAAAYTWTPAVPGPAVLPHARGAAGPALLAPSH